MLKIKKYRVGFSVECDIGTEISADSVLNIKSKILVSLNSFTPQIDSIGFKDSVVELPFNKFFIEEVLISNRYGNQLGWFILEDDFPHHEDGLDSFNEEDILHYLRQKYDLSD